MNVEFEGVLLPSIGTRITHHSGTVYMIVLYSNMASMIDKDADRRAKFPPTVVYSRVGSVGVMALFSRPVESFLTAFDWVGRNA